MVIVIVTLSEAFFFFLPRLIVGVVTLVVNSYLLVIGRVVLSLLGLDGFLLWLVGLLWRRCSVGSCIGNRIRRAFRGSAISDTAFVLATSLLLVEFWWSGR
mmetsp:Transcript_1481/g.1439  ORF Transcript_1481/g.1439 Transcript_1481/m.1439 type:complete len:101 (+) Transcript_1481:143-445(+)